MYVRRAFRDAAFKRAHRLGSVNSVNVVRLLVQVVQSRTISGAFRAHLGQSRAHLGRISGASRAGGALLLRLPPPAGGLDTTPPTGPNPPWIRDSGGMGVGDLRPPEGSSERRARVAVPCGAGGLVAAGRGDLG